MDEKARLEKLIEYAETAKTEAYPYEVIDEDLWLTVKALKAYTSAWISVKDRLPEVPCGHHLVFTPREFKKMHVVWWNGDLPFNGEPTGWEDFIRWRLITHWMPLPEQPRTT